MKAAAWSGLKFLCGLAWLAWATPQPAAFAQKYEGWRLDWSYGMKAAGSSEWCVPPMYEQTWGCDKAITPIFLAKRGEYYGYIDEDNNTILPFDYLDASSFFDRLATVRSADDSLYYAIDLHGQRVSGAYRNLSSGIGIFFGTGMDGKHYLFDKALQPRGNKAYENLLLRTVQVNNVIYQYFLVKANGLWGAVDAEGGELLPCEYHTLKTDYVGNVASVSEKLKEEHLTNTDFPLLFVASKAVGTDRKSGKPQIRYGLVNLQGREVLPFEQYGESGVNVEHGKRWKKVLLPYARQSSEIYAWAEGRLKPVADRVVAEAAQLTARHPSDYVHPTYPTLHIQGSQGRMTLSGTKGSAAGRTYRSITAADRYYIVQAQSGRYGLLGRDGQETLPCLYDSITVFRPLEKGGDLLLLHQDGKQGIAWADGSLMLPCWYDALEKIPGYHVFMAVDGGSYRAYKYTGVPKHVYAYDSYAYDPATGKVTVDYGNGLISLPMDKWGNDDLSRQIWLLGYHAKAKDRKLYYYLKAFEAADNPDSEMSLLILRNIGSVYASLGDKASERKYYQMAAARGDENAVRHLGLMDAEEVYGPSPSFFDIASGLLNTIISIKSAASGGASLSAADGGSASEGVASGRDLSYYQRLYSRWDNRAKELYEDLTSRGTRRTRRGEAVSGSNSGYWNGAAYRNMKHNLRDAQRNMKRIRMEARAAGHDLPQSSYETVQVSY